MYGNVIVYPYSRLFAPFLRHIAYTKQFDVQCAIMPGRWYKDGVDAAFVDENPDIGIPIKQGFEDQVEYADTIIWAEYEYGDKLLQEKVWEQMRQSLKKGKRILCCQELKNEDLDCFCRIANSSGSAFEYKVFSDGHFNIKSKSLLKIDVPIITVIGLSGDCQKMEMQLFLRRKFKERGYKVLQIGSRNNCELLEFHSFPQFMFNDQISEIGKMNAYYNYIVELVENEKPDVVIIGIPGGIYPLDDNYNLNYGITAFEVCNVIQSDCNIFNMWCDIYTDQLVQKMCNVSLHRLNTPIDFINLSNVTINKDFFMDRGHALGYNVYDRKSVEMFMEEINNPTVYSLIDDSRDRLFDSIMEKIS